jgi:hypothetical protein
MPSFAISNWESYLWAATCRPSCENILRI